MPAVSARLCAVFIALVMLGGACDSGRRDPGPELLDEVDVVPEITVEVDATGFDPDVLSVEVGEAFDVVNVGDEPHSFRVESPYVDTGLLLPGENAIVVLTTVGSATAVDSENENAALDIEVTPAG